MVLLEASSFAVGHGGSPVISRGDLSVSAGEIVALVGANGGGKTTTLLALSGLHPLVAGRVVVLGRDLAVRRRPRRRIVRTLVAEGLAHVPEDRGLFTGLTVAENLELGRPPRGSPDVIDEVLDLFAPLRLLLGRRSGLLSGGEQQMLAIARALVRRPRLILVDELSLGLAPRVAADVRAVLRRTADESGTGVLMVDQQVAAAADVADRTYLAAGARSRRHFRTNSRPRLSPALIWRHPPTLGRARSSTRPERPADGAAGRRTVHVAR